MLEMGEPGGRTVIEVLEPGTSFALGASYEYTSVPAGRLGFSHTWSALLRFDIDHVVVHATLGYGIDEQEFGVWRFDSNGYIVDVAVGYAFDIGDLRLSAGAISGAGYLRQSYDSGRDRSSILVRGGGGAAAIYPRRGVVSIQLAGAAGAASAPAANAGGTRRHDTWTAVSGAVVFRLPKR